MSKSEILESIPCPICGNDELQTLSKSGQFDLPCHVSICPSDGFVFLSPRWSKDRYMHFYQNEYDSVYRPTVYSNESNDSKFLNIKTICTRLESLNLIEGKESVLDIGAGMGWSLQWLKQNYNHFQRFSAIESSKYCAANLKDVIGARVISNDIDTDWKSTGFDFVIMRHVLEHFMNPVEALNKVAKNISEDGIVYIAVPDMMNPKGSLINYWFRSVHTFYFSEKTLASIASLANLQVIEIGCENHELWGVFKKVTSSTQRENIENVYGDQIRVIKDQQRKTVLLDSRARVTKLFSYMLPRRIKSWLKSYYLKLKV